MRRSRVHRGGLAQELADLLQRAGRQVLGHAAGPDVGVVHPQPGDQLHQVEHVLPHAHALHEDRGRAQLQAERPEAAEVRADPVELHHQHPDDVGPVGDLVLDAEQPLDGQAVRRLVEDRHQVVRAGAERDALRPGAVLHVLLDAGVQVADPDAALGDGLPVQGQDQPEHPVRRRVLRAHVDDHVTGARRVRGLVRGGDQLVPVLAGRPCRRRPSAVPSSRPAARGGAVAELVMRTTSAHRAAAPWCRGTRRGCRRAGSPCAAGGPSSRPASRSGSATGGRRR